MVEQTPYRYIYQFIHNVYADFFRTTADMFLEVYPLFNDAVIAPYHKAVEYLRQQQKLNREEDKPNLPAMILNPIGEFEVADGASGGKFLWRHPNLLPGFVKFIFEPVYQDKNVMINVGFLRMKGTIEILALLESFYEYCDFRLLLIQFCGGMDRWIYPSIFTSFIILPDELRDFRYTNEYTGRDYRLNWESAGAYEYLVRSTARNEVVLPVKIRPQYRLTSLGDNSDRYGGTETLADWRMTATFEYEIELPAYMIMQVDYLVQNVVLNVKYGSVFSAHDYTEIPSEIKRTVFEYDWGLDETSNSIFTGDSTSSITYSQDLQFNTRYYHVVTQEEADSTADIIITIPEEITDPSFITLNGPVGPFSYGDHYVLDDSTTIRIKKENVSLRSGTVVELYTYKET